MFNREVFGLDISDASIEALQLKPGKEGPKLAACGRIGLAAGIVENGKILDRYRLGEAIREVLAKASPQPITAAYAIVSLPETRVFSHIFQVPKNLSLEQVKSALAYEMEGIIPFDKEDVYWDFRIIAKDGESQEIFLAACPNDIIGNFSASLKEVGIFPLAFETESSATARALVAPGSLAKEAGLLIADIGSRVTILSIFDKSGIRNAVIIPSGGGKLTAAIAEKLELPLDQAETVKEMRGLNPEPAEGSRAGELAGIPEKSRALMKEGAVRLVLESALRPILEEMRQTIGYYESTAGRKIKKIILVGGSAALPKLDAYLGENLGLPAVVGRPWLDFGTDAGKISPLFLTTAFGLALRGLAREPAEADINLLPVESPEMIKNFKIKAVSRIAGRLYARYGRKIQGWNLREWLAKAWKYRAFFLFGLALATLVALYCLTRIWVDYGWLGRLAAAWLARAVRASGPAINLVNISGLGGPRLPSADFASVFASALAYLLKLLRSWNAEWLLLLIWEAFLEAAAAVAGWVGRGSAYALDLTRGFGRFVCLRLALAGEEWLISLIVKVADFLR